MSSSKQGLQVNPNSVWTTGNIITPENTNPSFSEIITEMYMEAEKIRSSIHEPYIYDTREEEKFVDIITKYFRASKTICRIYHHNEYRLFEKMQQDIFDDQIYIPANSDFYPILQI